jgi:hypothetical protein
MLNVRIRLLAFAAAAALLPLTGAALAADAPKAAKTTTATTTTAPTTTTTATSTAPAADANRDAMMAEMMKNAAPGPQHAALKNQEGTWNATVTSFVDGPTPMTTTGTETRNMILGGRFLETKYTGSYMGQPYEGWGLTGYDNKNSKVLWVWADNMSTKWMDLSGTMTPDGKTITCNGSIDGMTGTPMPIHVELKFDTDTQMTYTMYGNMKGQDTKMMQIVYTKAAATSDAQSK